MNTLNINRDHDLCPGNPSALASRSRGFTLVEVMVALSIMAILLLSLGSVVALATKAIPPTNPPASDTTATHEVLRVLDADLELASDITAATATSLKFKVADRNSDGVAETIWYSWTGIPGDPLQRMYNSNPSEPVVARVQSMSFAYSTVAATVTGTAVSTTSAEQLFYANDATYDQTKPVASGESYGQTISPLLPTNATSWKLTRVRYIAAADGTKSGTITLNIRPVSSSTGLPSATSWASGTRLESTLTSSFNWYSFDASAAPAQPPGGAMAFTLSSATSACQIRYASTGFAQSGSQLVYQMNGVPAWIPTPDGSMMVQIYGTYTSPVAPTTAVKRVTAVAVTVQSVGGGPAVRVLICPRGRPIGAGL